jgi:hypothetical protein
MFGAPVPRPADAFEYLGFPDVMQRGAVHRSRDRDILIVWNENPGLQGITPLRFVLHCARETGT